MGTKIKKEIDEFFGQPPTEKQKLWDKIHDLESQVLTLKQREFELAHALMWVMFYVVSKEGRELVETLKLRPADMAFDALVKTGYATVSDKKPSKFFFNWNAINALNAKINGLEPEDSNKPLTEGMK